MDDATESLAPDRSRHDRGLTLVEMVVTIALIGLVVLPILAAVAQSIKVSALSRSAAQVETAIVNVSDAVNRVQRLQCVNDPGTLAPPYTAAARSVLPADWAGTQGGVSVSTVYLAKDASNNPIWATTACPLDANGQFLTPRNLVQRVTITVTSPDGAIKRTSEVVKSDV
jgi:type II secretory pathway pseudopilin PulG